MSANLDGRVEHERRRQVIAGNDGDPRPKPRRAKLLLPLALLTVLTHLTDRGPASSLGTTASSAGSQRKAFPGSRP